MERFKLGLAALGFLFLGQDVDVEAGELRGQNQIDAVLTIAQQLRIHEAQTGQEYPSDHGSDLGTPAGDSVKGILRTEEPANEQCREHSADQPENPELPQAGTMAPVFTEKLEVSKRWIRSCSASPAPSRR